MSKKLQVVSNYTVPKMQEVSNHTVPKSYSYCNHTNTNTNIHTYLDKFLEEETAVSKKLQEVGLL